MLKISAVISLLAALATASIDNSLDLKLFHFTRVQNGLNFEYTLDNGENFIGRAFNLNSNVYMMIGADDTFYWVNFSEDDLKEDSFDKIVNYVQLDRENEVLAQLKDDFVSYFIRKDGQLIGGRYNPDWDVDNVAFRLTHTEGKIFDYIISSKNNGIQYRGKTSYTDDPHVHKIIVPDRDECYLFHTTFTDDELNSSETIYKQLNESLVCEPPLIGYHPGGQKQIDSNLLKSLAG